MILFKSISGGNKVKLGKRKGVDVSVDGVVDFIFER